MKRSIRTTLSWFYVLGLDGAISALAWVCAFLIRFDGAVPSRYRGWLLLALPGVVLVRLVALVLSGLYRSSWRFVSTIDMARLLKGVVSSSALLGAAALLLPVSGLPRSILVLDGMLALVGIGGARLLYRLLKEGRRPGLPRQGETRQRLLIVGAGTVGELLLRGLLRSTHGRYLPVGFVDDDSGLRGREVHGVPVLGRVDHIPTLVKEHKIEEIAVAIPSASVEEMARIVDRCMEAGCRPKIVPDMGGVIQANGGGVSLREVEGVDLLPRKPVELDTEGIAGCLEGKTVLVTGAAGSIGSELCRQVLGYGPRRLILFDQAETDLYFLDLGLRSQVDAAEDREVIPMIGDVTDRRKVEEVIEQYRPEVVFHAAAYKHVPLMESHPEEAMKNNLGGTITVASLSAKYHVERFVLVSTDKAVRPTSMMGVSKRLCELFLQATSGEEGTRFITVRFGNVLGSAGSVVPLFERQIRAGGPVTVTHPDIVRYFMTIPEAVGLVLQAGTSGQGGELFVLNMGQETRILDLAERLIRLSGMEPYRDIPIEFTGLRPGEKMYENLWIEGEVPEPTAHENIFIAHANGVPMDQVHPGLTEILSAAERSDRPALMERVRTLVPKYQPDLHRDLSADTPFRHRTRILVADDDRSVLGVLRGVFEPDFEVITADRGDTALEKVFAEMPDLLVLDIRMPGMDGHEVCDRIKRHPMTREMPVLILSALDDVENRVAGFHEGADLYLTKPFSAKELRAATEMLLNGKGVGDDGRRVTDDGPRVETATA